MQVSFGSSLAMEVDKTHIHVVLLMFKTIMLSLQRKCRSGMKGKGRTTDTPLIIPTADFLTSISKSGVAKHTMTDFTDLEAVPG